MKSIAKLDVVGTWELIEDLQNKAFANKIECEFQIGDYMFRLADPTMKVGDTIILMYVWHLNDHHGVPKQRISPSGVEGLRQLLVRKRLVDEFDRNIERLRLLLA